MKQNYGKIDSLNEKSPMRMIIIMSIPSILSQMVGLINNVIDRIFVGRIAEGGQYALAGLGIAVPIVTIYGAVANLVGRGVSPMASIQLGKGNREETEQIVGNGITLLVFLGILGTLIMEFGMHHILKLFGTGENVYPYAESYLQIYCVGTLFYMIANGTTPFLIAQGENKRSMYYIAIGTGVNIGLNYYFIFQLHFGVEGAAIATVAGEIVIAVLNMAFLIRKDSAFTVRLSNCRLRGNVVKDILVYGFTPFFQASSEGIVQILFNYEMAKYGSDLYITEMSIIFTISQFLYMPLNGMSNGVQPILSFNYGKGDMERTKRTLLLECIGLTIFSCCAIALLMISPDIFIKIFVDDQEIIKIGTQGVRLFFLGSLFRGIHFGIQGAFIALGKPELAFIGAAFRKIILLIPLLIILPSFLGVNGVYIAESITDSASVLMILIMYFAVRNKIFQSTKEEDGKEILWQE